MLQSNSFNSNSTPGFFIAGSVLPQLVVVPVTRPNNVTLWLLNPNTAANNTATACSAWGTYGGAVQTITVLDINFDDSAADLLIAGPLGNAFAISNGVNGFTFTYGGASGMPGATTLQPYYDHDITGEVCIPSNPALGVRPGDPCLISAGKSVQSSTPVSWPLSNLGAGTPWQTKVLSVNSSGVPYPTGSINLVGGSCVLLGPGQGLNMYLNLPSGAASGTQNWVYSVQFQLAKDTAVYGGQLFLYNGATVSERQH